MNTLPGGWEIVAFEDVVVINPRKSFDLGADALVTFVPMSAVSESSGTIVGAVSRRLQDVHRRFRQFAENDVIFAKITPSMENGKAAVARGLVNGVGFGSTEFHVLRSQGAVVPEYLWYYIRQQAFRADARVVMTGAVGQQRVPADYLRRHRLALPPLAEQKRIVAKIAVLVARMTRARVSLDGIPSLVKAYKENILGLAFAGELTKEFRRRSGLHDSELDDYPSSWTMRTLGEISDIQSGIQVGKRRSDTTGLVDIAYLRVANVQRGWLNLDDVKTIPVTAEERHRLLLQDGDILMNEGGDRDKLGRGWIWEGQIDECIHQNHVFRIRLKDRAFPPHYISYYANEKGQQYFTDRGTQTTKLASVSKGNVAALPVPIPPADEASVIVERIKSSFAWIDRVAAERADGARLIRELEAAVLASAFRGELVEQNPSEELASDLVARTVAEKQTSNRPKRTNLWVPKEKKKMSRSLLDVLIEAGDWLPAQEAFRRCGISDGTDTDYIETVYLELRALEKAGRVRVKPIVDSDGRKLQDMLALKDK